MRSGAESIELEFTEEPPFEPAQPCVGISQIHQTGESCYRFSEAAFMAETSGARNLQKRNASGLVRLIKPRRRGEGRGLIGHDRTECNL